MYSLGLQYDKGELSIIYSNYLLLIEPHTIGRLFEEYPLLYLPVLVK